ncbi:hypothetical protein IAT40_008008 [Kwoniella sp. CBS 6097]
MSSSSSLPSTSRYRPYHPRPIEAAVVPVQSRNYVDSTSSSTVYLSSENAIATASPRLSKLLLSRGNFSLRKGPLCVAVGCQGSEVYCEEGQGIVSVAVEWPEDRRLSRSSSSIGIDVAGKGKDRGRNLVIWAKVNLDKVPDGQDVEEDDSNDAEHDPPRLHVHPSLIPTYAPTPSKVLVHSHEPFELTLAILQPVLMPPSSSDEDQDQDQRRRSLLDTPTDLDLRPLYGNELQSPDAASSTSDNNHQASPSSETDTTVYPPILRQGEIIFLRSSAATSPKPNYSKHYKLSLLEPVSQGILTPSTRVILSTTPYTLPDEQRYPSIDGIDGDIVRYRDGQGSEGSYSKTHLSLADFDPDAFLSSSLSLTLPRASTSSPRDEEEQEVDLGIDDGQHAGELDIGRSYSQSSSTSGSLTPRPGHGHGHGNNGDSGPPSSPPAAFEDLLPDNIEIDLEELEAERGARFTAIKATGAGSASESGSGGDRSGLSGGEGEDVCWMGVGGLGRAGIFEGDWVLLRASGCSGAPEKSGRQPGRLVKALAWERLDEIDDDLPANPILLPPALYRSLIPSSSSFSSASKLTSTPSIIVQPTSFGARAPTLPIARTITLARIATTEGTDKRFERSWLEGLKKYFSYPGQGKNGFGRTEPKGRPGDEYRRLVRSGDIISVPVWPGNPLSTDQGTSTSQDDESDDEDDQEEEEDDIFERYKRARPTAVAYFTITSLSYDPLVPLEEDFRSSISSKGRAGELGCCVDVGVEGSTKMVLTGVEKQRVADRAGDLTWHGIDSSPPPFSSLAATKLRDLLRSTFASTSLIYALELSILVKGVRGSGKRCLIRSVADQLGYNIVDVECYDIVGDTSAVTAGTLLARLEKAKTCAPSLLVLHHIEALAKKTESSVMGRPPPIVKVIEELMDSARTAIGKSDPREQGQGAVGWPIVVMGTTIDGEALPNELAGCFKQEVEIKAPDEAERLSIIQHALRETPIAPDVDLLQIARQTAALNAGDIAALLYRAHDFSLKRISSVLDPNQATLLNDSRYPQSPISIARSQPRSIVDVIRAAQLAGLPLTSIDLNQAISEARSAYSDSIGAPKIPNVSWDDVGGLKNVKKDILDTIQLPLEKPELFGEGLKKRSGILLYGPPGTAQLSVIKALTRKFQLAPSSPASSVQATKTKDNDYITVDGNTERAVTDFDSDRELMSLVEKIPFNYTGADLYALCSDAMLNAMTRCANAIDDKIAELNAENKSKSKSTCDKSPQGHCDTDGVIDGVGGGAGTTEITPQYYLSKMASQEEMQVQVTIADFEGALGRLKPSVSEDEMRGYEAVQKEFRGFEIGQNKNKSEEKKVERSETGSSASNIGRQVEVDGANGKSGYMVSADGRAEGNGDGYGAGDGERYEMGFGIGIGIGNEHGEPHGHSHGNSLNGLLGRGINGKSMHLESTTTPTAKDGDKDKGKGKAKAVIEDEGEEDEGVD